MSFEKNEQKKVGYYFFNGIPLVFRGILLFGLILGGLAAQFIYGAIGFGFLLLIAAATLGLHRSIKQDIRISGRRNAPWENVTIQQWRTITRLQRKQQRWARDITNIGSGPGMSMAIVLGALCFFMFTAYIDIDEGLTLVFVGDAILLFLPALVIGGIHAWNPPQIDVKLKALTYVYEHFSERPDLELRPMLQVAPATSSSGKGSVPVDARLMIRIVDQPETFYGVQVQCSINKVGSTPYPYVYGVVLSAPDFHTNLQPPGKIKEANAVVEQSATAEARVIVVRQKTTKTSGYHTKPDDQVRIVKAAVDLAHKALEARI